MKFNDLFHYPFYKQCWKQLFIFLVCIGLTKLTAGAFGVVIVVAGVWGALTRKPAYALICFALLPFMTIMNPYVFGFGGMLGMSARLGMPIMTLAMLVASAQRPGRNYIPFGAMFFYIVVAAISSINGYCPMISYFKLANYALFVTGISVGTKNLDRNERDLNQLRSFFFMFAVFIVVGSYMLHIVNPFAAHAVSYTWELGNGGVEAAKAAMVNKVAATGDAGYLCGVVNHSQCLGPTVACIAGWVLCDMLFVEKKFMLGHVLLLVLCPVVLYMTMSRTSLLAFLAVVGIVTTYCVPKFRVSSLLKRRIRSMITTAVLLLIVAAGMLEVSKHGVSKWILKYAADDPTARISVDQVTATRKGVIEEAMSDFHKNPMLGKGFQVMFAHQFLDTSNRLILSAPIEKGFIPTMILGETGVAGAIAFSIFLLVFYTGCSAKKYWVTMALFTTFLVTNLGEATFFSPGGTGGPEWIFSLVGGFVVDMTVLVLRRKEIFLRR